MNAPVLDDAWHAEAQAAVTAAEWRRLALPLGLGVLTLIAVFNKEVSAAAQTWNSSTAYNHCFLIIPIALYLLWDRRIDLAGLRARPAPRALLLGLPLALAWLAAERLGIMEGRQLAAVSFLQLLLLAILGKRMWWAMAGPLLYLYFLVPFGEFLTPALQNITTWFVRHGLDVLGIPAYIDGYVIEIPQGTFFVAEACAGLRFLVASIAFGWLYALLIYRSPLRRGLFILVSIVVPVIANGLRALGIVVLGYALGSAQAAAADHIIYGWVFFSVVLLLLIALGLPFRQDQQTSRLATPPNVPSPLQMRTLSTITAATVCIAAISPALAAALTLATAVQTPAPTSIDPGEGCLMQAPAISPTFHVQTQRVVCNGAPMNMSWEAFSPRITAAPLMAERRRLVLRTATEGLRQEWLATSGGSPSAWRIMQSDVPAFSIAVSVWVNGQPVRPGLKMRAAMAVNSLTGSMFAPMIVTVTPAVQWDELNGIERSNATASLPAFLLAHPDLDRTVGALSAR